MSNDLLFDFSVNKENNTIKVIRQFAANLDLVWDAWTKPEIIDQWEAPRPWHAETKSMDFREGGFRLYAMVSPEGEKKWGRIDYQKIEIKKSFSALKTFCDENGNVNPDTPRSSWNHTFNENSGTTTVEVNILYQNAAHLEMMVKYGFKEGLTMGLENLDELLLTLKKGA